MQQSIKAWVYGKVQGVGYRLYCKRNAKELGLDGYALNLPDGRVEVFIQGDDDSLQVMVERLREGPHFSKVLGMDVETSVVQNISGFMTG